MKIDLDLVLAPLDSSDMETIRGWRNDYRIWQWCRQNDVISDVEQRSWFERQSKDDSIRMWKLVLKTAGHDKTVGVCGLTSIDWLHRRAEFSLYIRPDCQRRGFARAGLTILFEHAFKNFGLNQIWGETFAGNPALKLFRDMGMKEDGLRRQFYFRDGRFIDCHLVSILAEEWFALRNPDGSNRGLDPAVSRLPETEAFIDPNSDAVAAVTPVSPIRKARQRGSKAPAGRHY